MNNVTLYQTFRIYRHMGTCVQAYLKKFLLTFVKQKLSKEKKIKLYCLRGGMVLMMCKDILVLNIYCIFIF